MATEGKRIAQKLKAECYTEEMTDCSELIECSRFDVEQAAALIDRELEAERKAVDDLLMAIKDAVVPYTVRNAAARLRKMRG